MSEPFDVGRSRFPFGAEPQLPGSIVSFGRALRLAGVHVDTSRIGLAVQAATLVDIGHRADVCAAMEAAIVSREQDRYVFRELFDLWFRAPSGEESGPLQASLDAAGAPMASQPRRRIQDALEPPDKPAAADPGVDVDTFMTASDRERLNNADFGELGAAEYRLVERLARELTMPSLSCRRLRATSGTRRNARIDWPRAMYEASRLGGEVVRLPRMAPRRQPLPLLALVDVSGSMNRYARPLLAFLHATAQQHGRCQVFAFGTRLTDLAPAFRLSDGDAMLRATNAAIEDFAGGTRLGESLTRLRRTFSHRLTRGRTLVALITDGLDRGDPDLLESELKWLARNSRRLLWLNPLLRFDNYKPLARGPAILHRHADAALTAHNLDALQKLAASLAELMNSSR